MAKISFDDLIPQPGKVGISFDDLIPQAAPSAVTYDAMGNVYPVEEPVVADPALVAKIRAEREAATPAPQIPTEKLPLAVNEPQLVGKTADVPLPPRRMTTPEVGDFPVQPVEEAPIRTGGAYLNKVLGANTGMLTPEESLAKKQEIERAAAERSKRTSEMVPVVSESVARAKTFTDENGRPLIDKLNELMNQRDSTTDPKVQIAAQSEIRDLVKNAPKEFRNLLGGDIEKAAKDFAYQAKIAEVEAQKAPAPTQTFARSALETTGQTIGAQTAGTISGLQRVVTSPISLIEAVTGNKEIVSKEIDREAKELHKTLSGGFTPDIAQADDLGMKVVQGIASTAGFVGTGGVATKAFALPKTVMVAIAGGLPQAEEGWQEALRRQEEDPSLGGWRKWVSFASGLGIGATEALPIGNLFNRLEKATNGGLTRYLAVVAANSGEEGVQEALQQLLQNANSIAVLKDPNVTLTKDVAENALVGALAGAVFSGGLAGASAGANEMRGLYKTPEEAPAFLRSFLFPEYKKPEGKAAEEPKAAAAAPAEEAAPAPAIPDREQYEILKGAGFAIDDIADMTSGQREALAQEQIQQGTQPVALTEDEAATIAPKAPAAQPSPEQPVEAPGPEAAPAPEAPSANKRPTGYNELRAAGYTHDQVMKMGRDVITNPNAPLPSPEGEPDPSWLEYRGPEVEAPAAPSARAEELVQQGVPPLQAMQQAASEPIAPAALPEVAAAPEPKAVPIEPVVAAAPEIAPAAPAPEPAPVAEPAPAPAPTAKPEVTRIVSKRKGASWIIQGRDANGKKVFQLDPIQETGVARDTVYRLVGEHPKATLGVARKITPKGMASISMRKPPVGFTTLRGFIERIGGIREERGELASRDVPENLIRENGVSHEEATRRAIDAGFFPEYVPPALRVGEESYQAPPEMIKIFRDALGRKKFDLPKKEQDAQRAKERKEQEIENDILGPYIKDIKDYLKARKKEMSDTDIRDMAIMLQSGEAEDISQAADIIHFQNDMELIGNDMEDLDREVWSEILGQDIWDDMDSLAGIRQEGELRPEGIEPLEMEGEVETEPSPAPEVSAAPREGGAPSERPAEKKAPEAVGAGVEKPSVGKPEPKVTVKKAKPSEEISGTGLSIETVSSKDLPQNLRQDLRRSLLERYFKPGNVVSGYGGKDRVIKLIFNEDGNWSVIVKEVFPDGTVGRERQHSTFPEPKEFRAALGEGYDNSYVVKGDLDGNKKILDSLGFKPVRTVKGQKQRLFIGENPTKQIQEEAAKPAPAAAPVAEKPKAEPTKATKSPTTWAGWLKNPEQFSKSPNMPQEYLDILAEWATMLGIKGKIHLMLDNKDIKNFIFAPAAQKRPLSGTTGGERIYYPKQKASIIRLNLGPRKSYNLEIIAHELGHVFEKEIFNNSSQEEKDAIIADYKKFLKENKESNTEDYIRALRSHVAGKLTIISPSFKKIRATTALKDPYWRSFNEYFADQVAKYMVSEERPQTVVGKYFARIADGLKRLYNSLAGMQGKARRPIKEYIDRRVNARDNILDEEVLPLEAAAQEIVSESKTAVPGPSLPGMEEERAPRRQTQPKLPGLPTPQATVLDYTIDRTKVGGGLVFNFMDRFVDLQDLQKAIETARGAPLQDQLDAYLALQLYQDRAIARQDKAWADEIEPMLEAMNKDEITAQELGLYAYAKHAFERNDEMRKRDPVRFADGGGSGLTNEQAQGILDDLAAEGRLDKIEEIAKKYLYPMIRKDVSMRYANGLLTQDQYNQYTRPRSQGGYDFYVPLTGYAEDEGEATGKPVWTSGVGKGFPVYGKEYRTAFGRESLALNPVYSVINRRMEGITRAEKQRVDLRIYNLIKNNPNPEFAEVIKPGDDYIKKLGADGTVQYVSSSVSRNDPFILTLKIGGKEVYIQFNRQNENMKRLVTELKGLGEEAGTLMKATMAIGRYFSKINTQWVLDFFLVNFPRDLQDALINLYGTKEGLSTAMLGNVAKSAKIIAKYNVGGELTDKDKALLDEWKLAGGHLDYGGYRTAERNMEDIERRLRSNMGEMSFTEKGMDITKRASMGVLNAIETINDTFDSTVRFAVYLAARENGLGKDKAAQLSRRATVDFKSGGKYKPIINALYPFSGAAIAGSRGLYRIWKSKRGRRALMSIVFISAMNSLLGSYMSDDDEIEKGKKDFWTKIKPHERTNSIIIPIKVKGRYIKIPIGFYLQPFWVLGDQIAGATLGQIGPMDAAANVSAAFSNAFNPLGSGSLIHNLWPVQLRGIYETWTNEDWLGRQMHPERPGSAKSAQYYDRTSDTSITIADKLNRLFGGNPYKSSMLDIYPSNIDYWANYLTGGVGRLAAGSYKGAVDFMEGNETPLEKMPVVRRFVTSNENLENTAYSDLKRNIDKERATQSKAWSDSQDKTLPKAQRDEAKKVAKDLKKELGTSLLGKRVESPLKSLPGIFRETDKKINNIEERIGKIQVRSDLTPQQKKALAKPLEDQIVSLKNKARKKVIDKQEKVNPTVSPLKQLQLMLQ